MQPVGVNGLLPRLVATLALDRANSWNQTTMLLGATLIGPPLGAALFVLSPGVPLAAQAASFLVAVALVATLAQADQYVLDRVAAEQASS